MASEWRIEESDLFDAAGQSLVFVHGAIARARLVFGEPHRRAFLHLYAADGTPLTHPGVDSTGVSFGEFPRLRGFSIGWNRVTSDLGCDDFWHAGTATQMIPTGWRVLSASASQLTTAVEISWRSAGPAAVGLPLLEETRTFSLEELPDGGLQIDTTFNLRALRELFLDGDAHHGGVQFRAAAGYEANPGGMDYSWEPGAPPGDGIVSGSRRDWIRLGFRLGGASHQCLLLNQPANPLEEIAWRNYGRFGYFFRHRLAAGAALQLRYRLLLTKSASDESAPVGRAACNREFARFLADSPAAAAGPSA